MGITFFDSLQRGTAAALAVFFLGLHVGGLTLILLSGLPHGLLRPPLPWLGPADEILLTLLGLAAAERATATERRWFRGRVALIALNCATVAFALRCGAVALEYATLHR